MNLLIVKNRTAYVQGLKPKKAKAAPQPPHEPDEFELIKRWDAMLDLKGEGVKKFREIKDASGRIIDYADVEIEGYLSTFASRTPSDRDGDVVEAGAFKETIKDFLANPVLLVDHINSVHYLAGNFTKVQEDRDGLAIKARVSNSPDMISIRFKIVEEHLKALSMGGIFYYKEDRRTIFKVKLWEGSLVAIPANQDALFRVRSLNDTEKKFIKSGQPMNRFHEFLRAQELQNQKGVAAA